MTDHLTIAIRRAIWAKDAPRLDPHRARLDEMTSGELARRTDSRLRAPEPQPWSPPRLDLIEPAPVQDRVGIIQRFVAVTYNIELAAMLGPRRAVRLARPRQIAIFICKELLQDLSLPRIGRRFNRDHTTVLHALHVIEQRRRMDLEFELKLRKLMDEIKEILA